MSHSRPAQLDAIRSAPDDWDIVVIGGGATGVGIAIDAAARGYRVALVEQHDFAKGTSSRSTKLIHGGVRYLEKFQVQLVREALRERGRLMANAAHTVYRLPTVVPLYRWWEAPYYRLGLALYDWFAGAYRLGRTRRLSAAETVTRLPTIQTDGLRGGVLYYDAGFDDARLLINMVQTAIEQGANCLNYAAVRALAPARNGRRAVEIVDVQSGESLQITARVVVNAAGPFSDSVRRLEDAHCRDWIVPSQGVHIVLGREFLPGDSALIVPRTRDGRVVFAIPWQSHTLVGTTDTPLAETPLEPLPREDEIDFLLETIAGYLAPPPTRRDILSVFAGIRPLVRQESSEPTSRLSRSHEIRVSPHGLVSVLGGKWTTYREMAEQGVDRAAAVTGLPSRPSVTADLPLHGCQQPQPSPGPFASYGADADELERLIASDPDWQQPLDDDLPYVAGQVVWAARHELACTVEDVLARRLRGLFVDAEAAFRAAPRVAAILALENHKDQAWQSSQVQSFQAVARSYRLAALHPEQNETP